MRKALAITGIMSAGKSTFASHLQTQWQNNIHNTTPLEIIEVDNLRREIVTSSHTQYTSLRQRIAQEFSIEYTGLQYELNRYSLTQKVFASKDSVNAYNELTAPAFKDAIAQQIMRTQCDVAIVWSHVLENSYQDIFLHNHLSGLILYLTVEDKEHEKRILAQSQKEDGLPLELIKQRLYVCSNQDEKLELLKQSHYPYLIFHSEEDNDFNLNIEKITSCFPCSQHGLSNRY
jgi:dephospho-CoA kinase